MAAGVAPRLLPRRHVACLRLVGPDGTRQPAAWDVSRGVTVGRGEDCDVVLADDSVSRHQARVLPTAEGFLLEDLGSANGTWVGEERILRRPLGLGERFRVGRTWLVLEDDQPQPSPSPDAHRSAWPTVAFGCIGAIILLCFAGLVGAGLWWYRNPAGQAAPATRSADDIMPLSGPSPGLDAATVTQVREVLSPFGTELFYAGKDPADPSVLRVLFASTGGEILELQMAVDATGVVTAGDVSVVSHGRDPARLKRILQSYRSP